MSKRQCSSELIPNHTRMPSQNQPPFASLRAPCPGFASAGQVPGETRSSALWTWRTSRTWDLDAKRSIGG